MPIIKGETMTDNQKEGLAKLKAVLKEYNLSIGFTCSNCSDVHALYDDEIEVNQMSENSWSSETILKTGSWTMDYTDIK